MGIFERFAKQEPKNEPHPEFKNLEADGSYSNGRTLDGIPAYEVRIEIDKGDFDILTDKPFLIKIADNPSKSTKYITTIYADRKNMANAQEWISHLDIDTDRIKEIEHPKEQGVVEIKNSESETKDVTNVA